MQLYNKKKIIKFGECIVVLFICFFFTCGKYNVKYSAIIENVYPVEVWKYVSDFKNMKILNPMMYVYVTTTFLSYFNFKPFKLAISCLPKHPTLSFYFFSFLFIHSVI